MGVFTSKIRDDGSFEPSKLFHWVKPAISGNDINGLGETTVRRPKPVYHYVKIKHPWRLWQNIFYTRVFFKKGYQRIFYEASRLGRWKSKNIATKIKQQTPEQRSKEFKEYLLEIGAGDVAITCMQPEWVVEGMEVKHPYVVTFAMPQEYEKVKTLGEKGIDVASNIHMMNIYNSGTKLAKMGADWFRERGFDAYGYSGPTSGQFTSVPAALAGGLGELGKHGSIIHPKFGSNFRIGYVMTDAPLVTGEPINFGADEFCKNCQVCSKACPPNAIYSEKQIVRGKLKWYVDFDKCISYFNEANGCGICIVVCPWSRPGVAEKLIVKMARKVTGKEKVSLE